MRLLIAHRSSTARAALAGAVIPGGDRSLEIVGSDSGPETLELLLQDQPPELALVDWDLPGIDGVEICRLVRDFHRGHDTHLVVLAPPTRTDTREAWQAGADDCVSTPAPAAALRACVEKGLRSACSTQASDAGPSILAPEPTVTLEAVSTRDLYDDVQDAAPAELRALAGPSASHFDESIAAAGRVQLQAKADPLAECIDDDFGPADLRAVEVPGKETSASGRTVEEPLGPPSLEATLRQP